MIIDKGEHPVLPQTAVLSDEKGTYVFIVNATNRVERRDVQRARHHGRRQSSSRSGLTGNERIVTTAAGFLREGESVNSVAANLQRGAAS